MKDDNQTEPTDELDFFDEKKSTDRFTETIRKAQRKTILRNILISFSVSVVLFISLFLLWSFAMEYRKNQAIYDVRLYDSISNPNVGTAGYQVITNGITNGILEYGQYKIIDGKPIDWGEKKLSYSIFGALHRFAGDYSPIQIEKEQGGDGRKYHRETKQLLMEFYHPDVEYSTMINDFPRIANMTENLSAEMAVSFTERVSPEQVRDMIPEGVSLQWYWVASHQDVEDDPHYDQSYSGDSLYGFDHREDLVDEEMFINNIKSGVSKEDGKYYENFNQLFNYVRGNNEEISPNQVTVLGAVITGTPENLLKMKEISIIRTGVLGATTINY
ncbi:hypothetical protein GH741_16050 [Aquibacillus halophilus]|uniref:Sigma factor regulator C-terminal domain-containing protein n=1 Tax=Aquibacillus halophilus TaxID=930132 RepID=A0A6A8DEN1_9BACI|nr:anti sigma factor C-terminal domain-containing protein [Aquibacillus halophilus]MRH44155.1 hypothetical protein [Aquibacillus halophilus]